MKKRFLKATEVEKLFDAVREKDSAFSAGGEEAVVRAIVETAEAKHINNSLFFILFSILEIINTIYFCKYTQILVFSAFFPKFAIRIL